jgi:hypothetical protein
MIGAQIEEGRGKRTGRRVIATEPVMKVEVSVEETASFLGVEGLNIITYVSHTKPDGSLEGQGEGVFASLQGDIVTWKGMGVGRFGENGSIHYSGSLSFTTTAQKLAKLNGMCVVFEWEIDAQGNTHSKMWEFGTAAGRTATAS